MTKAIHHQMIILLLLSTLVGCTQQRVDAQLEKLCSADGGMKVYEKVELPVNQFTEYGDPIYSAGPNLTRLIGDKYIAAREFKQIRDKAPTLTKYTMTVVDKQSLRVIGKLTYYSRYGGDIVPHLGPDSAKSCPPGANEVALLREIFVMKAK